MLQKRKVVMVPTNQASKLHISRKGELLDTPEFSDSKPDFYPQHLYFLSDEEIKEDWCTDTNSNEVFYSLSQHDGIHDVKDNWVRLSKNCKKIIATSSKLPIDIKKIYEGREGIIPTYVPFIRELHSQIY